MTHSTIGLRPLVRGAYDLQHMRMQCGLRLVANFKAKLGQAPGKTEEEALSQEAKEMLGWLRASYERITDGIAPQGKRRNLMRFEGDELISSLAEYGMVKQYFDLLKAEEENFHLIAKVLPAFPVYVEFLSKVKGCGPYMSGVLISEIDIRKAKYPSSLWMLAGYDTVQVWEKIGGEGPDVVQGFGELEATYSPDLSEAVTSSGARYRSVRQGRSRKAHHLVEREYVSRDGEVKSRKSVTFNPWLKTKLHVLATCFIKAGGEYADIYRNYKHRLESDPRHQGKTPGHRHNMSMRYMMKRFLADLYRAWRPLEGLPVEPEYQEAKLGHAHGRKAA